MSKSEKIQTKGSTFVPTTTSTDKVKTAESTTETSTSTTYKISSSPTEYGWVCPRCNKVNAPWKSTCDCSGGYYHPTWYPWDYKEPWWKQVYCDWKVPSSMCSSDSSTNDSNKITTTWSAINSNMTNPSYTSIDSSWNQLSTLTEQYNNLQNQANNLKEKK